MTLLFFESGKEQSHPTRRFKHQLYITIKKENALNLIGNIASMSQEGEDDTFMLPFAGELRED